MKIGDLVRIKQSKDPRYLGKLAIVMKVTWITGRYVGEIHIVSVETVGAITPFIVSVDNVETL